MTSDNSAGRPILGSLRSSGSNGVVRLKDRLNAAIDDVWSAITDPVRLAEWHAKVDGDLRPGGEFRIYVESDEWEGVGRVEACERPRRLAVTTRESDESWQKGEGVPPFDASVEVTLSPDGGETLVAVEVAGPPLDVIAFYGVGWQIHLENLAAYLGGRAPEDAEARFEALLPAYQELAAALG